MAIRIGEGENIDKADAGGSGVYCPVCLSKDNTKVDIPSKFIKKETDGISFYCPRCMCTGFM